ncbi:hypothetical protein R6Q59_010134 [Mikania micrantha]
MELPRSLGWLSNGSLTFHTRLRSSLQVRLGSLCVRETKTQFMIQGIADYGLDPNHPAFLEEAHSLFTSFAARNAGINYLDREVCEIARYQADDGSTRSLRAYGNPCQPAFEDYGDVFTYLPHPDTSATNAWLSAPLGLDQANVDIWLTHSPPRGRLDQDIVPPNTECPVRANCIARSRPLLAVFGHIHNGYGVEKVTWDLVDDKPKLGELLSTEVNGRTFDLSEPDMLDKDLNTLFVNAAWMTAEKTASNKRNTPWLLRIDFDTTKA